MISEGDPHALNKSCCGYLGEVLRYHDGDIILVKKMLLYGSKMKTASRQCSLWYLSVSRSKIP